MLKWTVTRRADEAGAVTDGENATTVGSIHGRRSLGALNIKAAQTLDKGVQQNSQTVLKAHQRRSLGSTATVARRAINRDKENRCTSTPHPIRERDPASRFDPTSALRDVSNITPTSTPTRNSPMRRKRPLCESIIQMTPINQQPPPQYASTLPTFDIEYSPCGVRPTPFVAIRGLGVADSYYEQPRYFVDEPAPPAKKLRPMPVECSPETGLTPLSNRLSELRFSRISLKRRSRTRNINNNNINEESLPSAAMGDVTLDRMIDAILESARKEKWKRKSLTLRGRDKGRGDNDAMKMCDPAQIASPTYTPAEDPASDLNEFRAGGELMLSTENFMDADRTIILEETTVLNEREVRTPDSVPPINCAVQKPESPDDSCHLRRQKAVRRKHRNEMERIGLTIPNGIPSLSPCSIKKKICRVGLTLPHGIPSPETPINFYKMNSKLCQSFDDLAKMDTPKEIAIIVDSDQEMKNDNDNRTAGQQTDSNFSKKSNDDVSPGIAAIDRQPSSTPTSTPPGGPNETPRVALTTTNTMGRRCLTFSPDLGSSEDSLEKRRSVASSVASRYSRCATVKGSLDLAIFAEGNKLNVHVIRCRDLQRPNNKPINAYVKVALSSNEANDNNNNSGGGGFQRTAVHRNSSRPYFDHRFTFDLNERNLTNSDINQKHRIQLAVWHRDREYKRSEFLGCMSFLVKNVLKKEVNGSFRLQPQTCLTNPQPPIAMGENSQSSCDEVNSLEGEGDNAIGSLLGNDGADSNLDGDNGASTIPLSKTALHQRDADENLFLRFLELDPPLEDSPPNAERRASSCRAPCGRTPFTITKRLTRTADKGFGFSIVWTHPPRIEKVEPGLSAASAGILPGDYVIFVDKTNIVTTPEVDILNLIKAQENVLLLEIFRRSARPANGLRSTGRGASFNSSQQGGCGGDEIHGHTISGSVPGSISCASATATATATVAAAAATIFQQQQSLPFQLQQPLLPISAQQQIAVARSATPLGAGARSSTACSNASISVETSKRRLHLPQVTFSKESVVTSSAEDQRRRFLYQLISREQHFVTALQFGMERFTTPLRERKDLISQNDHRTLFQNIDELMQISEDILEQLQLQDDGGGGGGVSIGVCNGNIDSQMHFVSRVYLSKTTAICAAYKKYCNGLKRADCVLVNKSRYQNSDFVKFINEPQVPRKRPDMTTFIHRPLQHYREILKLVQLISSHSRADTEENKNLLNVINEFQAAYREITVGGGLMEPLGEGRPLLTLQDLESRLVFTRCKPFILAAPGRQWIFGGDLSRVEGRSVKPYWTLLFSDILLFAKVSRDRVLFITEEPLQLGNITDSCFNIRKKPTEFRLTVDPNGRTLESPTTHCAPDLTKTPRRNARRRSIILRAPSPELKAVWQNLLQRQIFFVNAALGLTPLSSPLESPDILQTMLPLSDIGATTTSMASIKLSSNDSLPLRQHNLHFTQNLNQMQQINQQQQQQQQHQHQLNNNPVTHHLHQLQQQHQTQRPSDVIARKLEELIDEKCRLLNKTGTSKGGALHLAQWMKGQLDERQREAMADLRYSQQENHINSMPPEYTRSTDVANANVPGICQNVPIVRNPVNRELGDFDTDDHIEEWSREQLQQRSRELQLIDASGGAQAPPKIDAGVRLCESRLEEITLTDEESKSASRSTTSDSQITVRSSPIANATDKISVCRQCHKNCRSKITANGQNIPASGPVSSSLKVQHSQSSPNRCCSTTSGSIGANSIAGNSIGANSNAANSIAANSKRSPTNSTNSTATTTVTAVPSSETKASPIVNGGTDVIGVLNRTPSKCSTPCPCKCTPNDFLGTTLSPDELHHETCRLIPSVHDVNRTPTNSNNKTNKPLIQPNATTPTSISSATVVTSQNHKNCKCVCTKRDKNQMGGETVKTSLNNNSINNQVKKVPTAEEEEDDDWSRLLIGLAQINPTTSLVHMDPFEAVPTISIVPPTPEGKITRFGNPLMWDSTRLSLEDLNRKNDGQNTMNGGDNSLENSPDSPPVEEPPYRVLSTSLRRYGTMSSLEKLPSEDTEDKSYNSSDDEDNDDVDECLDDDDQSDIKIVTKEVYSNTQALRNWTARAGSFFEESRAFIDRYLGRTTSGEDQMDKEEENAEECTSGATSGEEVWGTPTSGGENDEMQMFNSDHAHSSPTKSTSSLTGDDDTELMMDELLMAPPMTASTVRGLLPRRRLEPLFEEDTESADTDDDDEKTPLDGGGGCYTTILGDGGLFNNLHKKQGQYMERVSIYGRVSRSSSESSSSDSAVEAEQHRRLQLQKHQDTMSRPKTNSPTTMTTTSMMMMAPIMPLPQQAANQTADVPITVMNTSSMAMTMKWVMRDGQATDIVIPSDTYCPSVLGGGGIDGNNIGKDEDDVTIVGYNVNCVEKERINGIGIGRAREELHENGSVTGTEHSVAASSAASGAGLSPRLEMRLALNQDILGDEDLMNYDPGPNLTSILGRDLSRYHRMTGREILNRSTNRVAAKEATNSFYQQKNSKMDTPTPNRRRSNQNTWNNFASVDLAGNTNLPDLEKLARQEKQLCQKQMRNGHHPDRVMGWTKNITAHDKYSHSSGGGSGHSINTQGSGTSSTSKTSKIINFLTRRNSENQIIRLFSRDIGDSSTNSLNEELSSTTQHTKTSIKQINNKKFLTTTTNKLTSITTTASSTQSASTVNYYSSSSSSSTPQRSKDYDKQLDRRFWKQLSKRRRSLSEITAN